MAGLGSFPEDSIGTRMTCKAWWESLRGSGVGARGACPVAGGSRSTSQLFIALVVQWDTCPVDQYLCDRVPPNRSLTDVVISFSIKDLFDCLVYGAERNNHNGRPSRSQPDLWLVVEGGPGRSSFGGLRRTTGGRSDTECLKDLTRGPHPASNTTLT